MHVIHSPGRRLEVARMQKKKSGQWRSIQQAIIVAKKWAQAKMAQLMCQPSVHIALDNPLDLVRLRCAYYVCGLM
jgi:hypothetical protein